MDASAYSKIIESPPRRPASYHFNETEAANIHKSVSQGELQIRNGSNLPSLPHRTQMHRLINRKSKKGSNKSKSLTDQESPNSDDRLLEVPFEELMRGKIDKDIIRKTRNSHQSKDNPTNKSVSLFMSDENVSRKTVGCDNGGLTENVGFSKSGSTDIKQVCSQCLRDGKTCIECEHSGERSASLDEVSLEDNELSKSRQYSRQFSDILLIPGPFDDQDKLGSPEDSGTNNVL